MDEVVGKGRKDRTCCSICEGYWNDSYMCVVVLDRKEERKRRCMSDKKR